MTSKLFGLVAGIGIGMAALAGGDIYEIVPCTELGTTTNAYATIDSPLTSGETVYFKLRLAPRTMAGTPWHLEHIGYGSQIVDDAMFPLQIGIFVSGDLRWAKLLRENVGTPENNYISEFIFSYKTRPGDFALPIVLAATETQPVVDCDETNSLLVDGMGKWKIVNASTVEGSDECNFWQWANAYPISGAGSRNGDFTLTSCGFYVRSMDFDSKWESDGTLWRSVHEGSTITVGAAPKIVAAGAPEDLVNLYVWSTDESAVRIKGGKATEIVTGYNGGTPVVSTCNVATVQFAAGQLSSSFLIEGVKEGETCNLVLSAWPNFRYDGSRNRYTDYIQVPVKCIEPMPPTVIVESSESAVYADSNYRVAKATLSVRVSQAYSNKLDVTVVPKFADGDTTLNWGDYVRFSPNANQVSSLPSADSLPTVTIPANSTEAQSLYVFFLRSDAHTTGGASQIDFTPELTDPAAIADFGSYLTAAGVEVLPSPAVITFPKETTKVSGVAGEANKLQVSVKDDFADETFFDEDGNKGYEVTVKSTDFAAPVTLPGYYYIGAGGQLLLAKKNEATGKYEKSSESPTITFPSDASSTTAEPYTSTVQVKSPVSGEIAEQTFLSVVARQRSATLTLVDGKYEINEGDKVPFKVSLSQGYEGTLYAYLRVRGNYAGMFRENSCVVCDDSDFSKTRGQIINMGMTETSQFLVQVLDGYSEDQPLTVQFQLEFCTTEYYSTSDKVNGYGSVPVTITSYNVEPTIKRLTLNGFDAEEDGYRFPFKLPKGMEQTVNAVVNDKGTYDVKSTATNDMFYTKWTCYLDGAAKTNATVRGNPETNPFVFNFPASGEWRVRCQVRDKDMDDWSEVDRSFYVTVLDNPTLEVKAVTPNLEGALVPIDDIYENDTKCKVQVQASYWDSAYYGVLTAKVTVAEYTPKTNPGFIKLDHLLASPTEPDTYYVVLRDTNPVDLLIESMDGTDASSLTGFKVTAEVVSDVELPTTHEPANEYYVAGMKRLFVENVAPECIITPEGDNTNRWEVAGGATSYTIRWQVRSDVDTDFTYSDDKAWTTPGIKVSFSGCDNGGDTFITEPRSGTFIPNFGSSQGDVDVVLTIEDKDHGIVTRTWHFTVTPSKMLETIANGPSGGITTSKLSQKYALLEDGIGMGHVYVSGATFVGADYFTLNWNCGKATDVKAYAFGYKTSAPDDNGTLEGGNLDVGIGPDGNMQAGNVLEKYFHYPYADAARPEDVKDSFFYCWLVHARSENDNTMTTLYLGDAFAPERLAVPGAQTKYAYATVPLPKALTEDKNYLTTTIEAIFSREWMPGDNLGDINQDGIPDYFAVRDWKEGNLIALAAGISGDSQGGNASGGNANGGNSNTGPAIAAYDLKDLAKENPDEDYLPGVYTSAEFESLVAHSENSYAPIGIPFNNRYEIRGFHDGLNAIDCTSSDPDFSKDEAAAWAAYAAASNLDVAVTNLTVWSPEPHGSKFARMDPTMEDTDGDHFPDGWEYFFWYQAHVWVPAQSGKFGKPKGLQRFVFERFDANNPLHGIEIPAIEVEQHFNPCEELKYHILDPKTYPDLDKDGLTDLEELALGTNPCHWDTDGDGMCDLYEVVYLLDPLTTGDRLSNTDGDYMAIHFVSGDWVYVDPDGAQDPESLDAVLYGVITSLERDVDVDGRGLVLRDLNVEVYKFQPKEDTTNPGNVLRYGEVIEPILPVDCGWGMPMVWMVENIKRKFIPAGTRLQSNLEYILVHNQVRKAFGFDPRTGWSMVSGDGYVADRWNPLINTELNPFDMTGWAENTGNYYAYDEYLLAMYRKRYSIVFADDVKESLLGRTTNPSAAAPASTEDDAASTNETSTASQETTAQMKLAEYLAEAFKEGYSSRTADTSHGADTDGDGVPDGWEIYNYRSPNKVYDSGPSYDESTSFTSSGFKKGDYDGDHLTFAQEYAGTDSCNVYKSCPSIYANHPGNKSGWFNKFFPTDPGDYAEYKGEGDLYSHDTDGDGVPDDCEGMAWRGDFTNGADGYYGVWQSFIYGDPADALTCCIRGGGMNPCTADTDLDGLPDGWEMANAGVAISLQDLKPVMPKNLPAGASTDIRVERVSDGTLAGDGINRDTWSGKDGVYIAGGMDATWPGDACTSKGDLDKVDKLVGVARDVDFDHDGLQNYQEYLVQAVRHFRYDDITTPLMGRLLTEGKYDGNTLETPHAQQFCGFVTMESSDPEAFAVAAAEAWNLGEYVSYSLETTGVRRVLTVLDDGSVRTNVYYTTERVKQLVDGDTLVHKMVGNTDGRHSMPWTTEGWRKLGYFAPPAHPWDRSVTCMNFNNPMYLFPITGDLVIDERCAGYVGTDPRMADTDKDGMDDYYEMFHGLNPILGSYAEQPDASAWSGGKRGDIISATYSMTVILPYQPYVRLFYNAFWNEWTHPDYNREAAFTPDFPSGNQPASGQNSVGGVALAAGLLPPAAYDPVLYPWTVGSPKVDADGDGMRNDEERIAPNVADPMPHHTDPSPAWFTDSSTRPSFVSQYYVTPAAALRMPLRPSVVEAEMVDIAMLGYDQGAYMFPFEENEGYDTDGDFVPDSREVTSPTLATSDPLRFDTPDRRQALYLDGVDSYAITKELEYRGVDAVDLLKQFTVECWICPEKSGVAQTIIDRAVYVDGSAVNKDACAIRSNFRIGLAPSGAVYGMFDNSDSIESGYNQPVSCQRVDGKVLPLNKWSHVALTYDGKELAIYVNGQVCRKAATSLVPANGVDRIVQEMDGLVGLSAYEYASQPSAVIVGARPKRENVYALYPILVDEEGEHHESFDNLQEFFQGWVDEVRVWDGARSAEQIEANYLHRLTFDDALANRQEIFNGWLNQATRNNNDMNETLAPELVMHYNFSSIAGAADPVKVAQAPIGFSSKTLGAAQYSYDEGDNEDLVPDGLYANVKQLKGGDDGEVSWTDADGENRSLEIGWWKSSRVHSLVYRDYAYVPWIQNTVAHLPRFDGSSPDSFYYGEHRSANYSLPADVGYGKVAFPNSADPYSYCVYDFERYQRLFTAERLVEVRGEDYAEFKQETQFVYRNNFIGSSDLVPLGHAFAKTTTNFWDGAASDPWEYTGDDSNADGLPDWWEMYARENYCNGILSVGEELNWDTYVNYKNLKIPAWKAYLIDLNRGMQPGGSVDPAYAATFDSDRDGIPDWWEKMFGVFDYGADDDTDGDGLSNYAEYLLTEVFDLGIVFDPADPFSASFYESDYFYKIGELYAGEVFTDHDMMEDAWELQRGQGYVNSCAWDADSDNDEDRWSAFAECRYNSFSAGIIADNITHLVGDTELKDFPVPTLRLTLRYNQSQPLNVVSSGSAQAGNNGEQNALAPIVVKTFTTKKTQEVNVVPDSSYTIQPGADLDRVYDLGGYSERVVRGVLTPGYIEPGSFEIQTAHVVQNNNYTWIVYNATYLPCGTIVGVLSGGYLVSGSYSDYMYYFNKYGPGRVELQYEGFEWSVLGVNPGDVTASQDTGVNGGYICLSGERIGTLDSQTGEFSIDMAAFGKWFLEGTNSVHSLKESIFRIVYKSRIPALQSNKLNLYLGTPNVGAVREGKNRIVAFFDLNNDGNYTPGEPLGFANDVDVGWYQGVCEMELTDTSPVITRADLSQMGSSSASGLASAAASALSGSSGGTASDRHVLYGNEDGDIVDLIVGELSGGSYQRFRVVRTLINGYGIQNLGVPNRVVVDKWIELDQRPFFFEGDVLENGELDIDWSHFEEEVVNNPNVRAANVDPTEVTYRIVLGNGTVEADATNNLYSIATVRHFDLASARPTPTTIAPGNTEATVYGSRPTFKWSLTSSNVVFNSYTAFKIQVMNESGSVVWDSGVRRAPAMNLEGVYSFTPDVYAGDLIKPDQKYTWRVSMYNAKFRTDKWSATSPKFQMFTQSDVHGYGSVKVCVKYYGPEAVLADGTVRVEAYPTPDFTGFPAARTYVADKATVSSSGVEHTANATLVGLSEGVYYVRAYIDGKSGASYSRDKWESWGYACPREVNPALMFSPTAIEVGSETAAMKTYTVYIEDVDTNGNCLPDAWEVVKGRGLAAGASSVEIVGGSAVTDDSLAGSLAGKVNADHIASRISSQVFSALFSADGAALVSNVPTTDGGKGLSQAAMVAQASQDADLEDVKITSISIEGGKVVVKAEGETPASRATSSGLRSMTAASEPEVVVKKTYSAHVLYATELGGGWRTADVPVVITVYSDGRAETSEIDVTALAGDRKACFFQIKID